MALNERKTEDWFISKLTKLGYFDADSDIVVEKQTSDNPRISKLLQQASKTGDGIGRPEFLIYSASQPNFLVVVECKANKAKLKSRGLSKPAEYAVDGALLYASYLSKGFDVLAIGVAGQSESTIRVEHHLHLQGATSPVPLANVTKIEKLGDYWGHIVATDAKFRQDYNNLLVYARSLNDELQSKKVLEAQRGFLLSAVLVALQNEAFAKSYHLQRTAQDLARQMLDAVDSQFESACLPHDRRKVLMQSFSFIKEVPSLHGDLEYFKNLINEIDENINKFIKTHKYYDTIGQFYIEFLRYANNDKGLGIVLTPMHIAELFAELADVNKNSIVYDNCCGTAGLLIAAMKRMVADAGADQEAQSSVKMQQLVGIEYQPSVYSLAITNMVLHGDGKTNLMQGNCFADTPERVGETKPNVGVLNPPYKNKRMKTDREELEYVYNNLSSLVPGGVCIAIVPITCATAPSGAVSEWKKAILSKHTLEAVLSMPIELFHNSKTTVVTCVMVITAHRPHPDGKKTWFAYCRDDGFVKTKHRGRNDDLGTWSEIRDRWVNAFRNRDVVDGFSVMHEVGAADEWCVEAYLETDYTQIGSQAMIHKAMDYMWSVNTNLRSCV